MTTRPRVVDAPPRRRRAVKLGEVRVVVEHDLEPDTSYLDEERAAAYERGDFELVGVRAVAEVSIDGVKQLLTSGGIWGIESDAREILEEHAAEEYAVLREILVTIGVPTSQVPLELDPQQIEWSV